MIVKAAETKPLSKTLLAREQGISLSSLYYKPKKPQQDWLLKNQIEKVLHHNPSYGHRRIALEMKINKKRIRRVMRLFGIKPYRRRGKKYRKPGDLGKTYPNLLQSLPFPDRANKIWVSDFTEIPHRGRKVFLATNEDLFDRQVKGWSLLTSHPSLLPLLALMKGVEMHGRPEVLHSDQGSEYKAGVYTGFAEGLGIKPSMSHKGSPWENGFQESFYSQFKVDLADANRYRTVEELAVAIWHQVYYYNHKRIHTKLKMPPATFGRTAAINN
jgi:transposase InsO family protein